jgi:hypothetical protein
MTEHCETDDCEDIGTLYYVSGGEFPTVTAGVFSTRLLSTSEIARGAYHTLCGKHALAELGVAFGGLE